MSSRGKRSKRPQKQEVEKFNAVSNDAIEARPKGRGQSRLYIDSIGNL
jgi:hypothetical protein